MIKIAVTGVIGSGKSTVAKLLSELGLTVIDADEISRSLTRKNTDVYHEIIETFGKEILNPDGEIDRKRLAEIVFSDPEKRRTLENIVHPAVKKERNRIIAELEKKDKNAMVVLDIPLLFEAGMEKEADYIVLAYADERTLFERVQKRDNMTYEEFSRRLKNQMPLSEKVKKSHFVVDTRKDLETLKKELSEVIRKIRAEKQSLS
ncbi:MAG: dephospho-CoA kinase [bacterium]